MKYIPLHVDGIHVADIKFEIVPKQSSPYEGGINPVNFYQALPVLRDNFRAWSHVDEKTLTQEQKAGLEGLGWKDYETRQREMQEQYESVSVYFQSPDREEILGLHATFFKDDREHALEAWVNQYTDKWKFVASVSRIHGPFNEEIEDMKRAGWIEIQRPAELTE